ncbi:sarcosine dehydrogenase [Mycolicibacterium arabiense]|uniref:Sarcosine dehydrogenase n=1 Tax=Mycolicibacterium arabiense TaxID=1286181 RepID=A0A7I7S442_9MYCO|nr:FAD-dependent oxidoreductase [Mycolicibacterium arabiense]MCV7376975.1 FAD-dependent oxidoreductase [Mycolicibacterium arabiense]BBY50755.1 sarcosine dehydrogenase [Mycolicibacterium arabiense]
MAQPKVVIIGAGIVGTSLADELTARGCTDVTVLDRGPMFATGGSTSHAPGLVFQTNGSKTMTELATYTVEKFVELGAFDQVGGLEVATTEARWTELHRRHGWARAWGVPGELIDPAACKALHPLLDERRIIGGFHTPTDGLARALTAATAQAERAISRGARFLPHQEVTDVLDRDGRVVGVRTAAGDEFDADVVVSAAGFWGAQLGARVGLTVPLVPMAHQYAKTGQLAELRRDGWDGDPRLPILRHQDQDLYYREHGDRLGIGFYGHRPMPVDMTTLLTDSDGGIDTASESMPSMLPFTDDDFAPGWAASAELLPALGDSKVEEGFNGIFSFTPDGFSIMGEHRDLPGFWVAEAVWVTHSAGVAKAMAEWILDGAPTTDVHECDLYRFEEPAKSPEFILKTSSQAFVEVYDILHPHQYRSDPRNLRVSPFHRREEELGAHFFEGGCWERPAWYEANAGLIGELSSAGVDFPERDDWSGRFYSPISIAEARWTREHVALYDMTPLTRYEVSGPGACDFLQRMTTNNVDKRTGSVTYTLMLDETGGIRSDLTVARLGDELFQVGANGPLDMDWIRRHLPSTGVTVRDVTGATCCVGVWGPRARDLVAPLCAADISHEAFGYFRALQTFIGSVPVTMMRVSYVGELGWEIYASAEHGLKLWDLLFDAGREHRAIAAGRIAFNSLRLEKGYRAWGTDMTTEHQPGAAGVGFAVSAKKGDFLGKAALDAAAPPSKVLRSIVFDDPTAVVLGKEPVTLAGADDATVGYVTSAGYSASIGRSIAYAWLPADVEVGDAVRVDYLTETYGATVHSEPVVDPEMKLIRR